MSLKAQLLNGTSFRKEVDIEFDNKIITFVLKPLSNAEYKNIQVKINKGQKKYLDTKIAKTQYIDLADMTERGFKANVEIFIKGVADEVWTEEEVNKLPAGLVDKVATKILEISGIIDSKDDKKKN
ncbi:hypothetical protein SAMN04489735_100259 [Aneurinibacillus thermoaerophilus]|uniref:Phage XkdN-like tail assembly chaperone protein, TAC n=1 Tax=Aneurinibacillus thermoaerophilus TaxID=143495 RepID=A0A1G7WQ93_ANETH|nr:hypothetical protein [Aneurinibacillus thermoaerophilus]SDG74096.1 hypothetical protein SAMN04489735_100259 [Aneurinibacillus thermoaerophilus]